jgi:hypothetical protein
MTPDEAMMRKLDAAGLHRARLMVAADLTHVVVDKARRLTEVPDPESEAFWLAYQGMFDAVRALDAMRLRDTIATSEQIVRDGPIYDLPCGHTVFDACEACTPDPDAEVFDIPGKPALPESVRGAIDIADSDKPLRSVRMVPVDEADDLTSDAAIDAEWDGIDAALGHTPREADFLDRWREGVAARADEFGGGGSL